MNSIRTSTLIEKLRSVPQETERVSTPFYEPKDCSDGMRYLYENVLCPILEGKVVATNTLDMDRFDRDDIDAIYDFYMDNYKRYSTELSQLYNWYQTCCNIPAKCGQTTFL